MINFQKLIILALNNSQPIFSRIHSSLSSLDFNLDAINNRMYLYKEIK